jgi:hypothetical protein
VFPKRNNRHSTDQGPIISGTPWLNGVKINGFSSYLFIHSHHTSWVLVGYPLCITEKEKEKKMQGILKNKMLAQTFWGGGRG